MKKPKAQKNLAQQTTFFAFEPLLGLTALAV
jgi:hypothetical protein